MAAAAVTKFSFGRRRELQVQPDDLRLPVLRDDGLLVLGHGLLHRAGLDFGRALGHGDIHALARPSWTASRPLCQARPPPPSTGWSPVPLRRRAGGAVGRDRPVRKIYVDARAGRASRIRLFSSILMLVPSSRLHDRFREVGRPDGVVVVDRRVLLEVLPHDLGGVLSLCDLLLVGDGADLFRVPGPSLIE